jgi:hypothetical protein
LSEDHTGHHRQQAYHYNAQCSIHHSRIVPGL